MNLDAMAYHGEPIPDSLLPVGRMQYLSLRAVYTAFKSGQLTQEEGQRLKGVISQYTHLSAADKAALLRTVFILLTDLAGRGDLDALADSKAVARAFHELTGSTMLECMV